MQFISSISWNIRNFLISSITSDKLLLSRERVHKNSREKVCVEIFADSSWTFRDGFEYFNYDEFIFENHLDRKQKDHN